MENKEDSKWRRIGWKLIMLAMVLVFAANATDIFEIEIPEMLFRFLLYPVIALFIVSYIMVVARSSGDDKKDE